jgi:hypothetical protein
MVVPTFKLQKSSGQVIFNRLAAGYDFTSSTINGFPCPIILV